MCVSGTRLTNHDSQRGEEKALAAVAANRNCRSGEDRHPERPTGVEGTLFGPYAAPKTMRWEQGEEKANRNIRQIKNRVNPLKTKDITFF